MSGLPYLVYKKLRTGMGLAFGLILFYGIYTANLSTGLLLIATGFFLLHLFGDCYNDYWDYDDDIRNKRSDKLTIAGLLSKKQIKNVSFLILILGLVSLLFTNPVLFFIGVVYSILLWAYSHPKVRLKKNNVVGYSIAESVWLFIPAAMDIFFIRQFSMATLLFTLFFFFQYLYLLSQKDSTDLKDATNLFLKQGWWRASFVCTVLALLSSSSLLALSMLNPILSTGFLSIWLINVAVKLAIISKIWMRSIDRKTRGKLVLVEFLTPYLYAGGVLFG